MPCPKGPRQAPSPVLSGSRNPKVLPKVDFSSTPMPSATPPVTSGPSLVRLSRAIRLAGILFAIAAPWSARSLGAGPEPVYNTLAFGIEDGLPSNVAEIMVQTRDGYLWVGTEAGLARFNGQEIATFPAATNPELGSNLIRCLAEDASGTLWIGTQRGLSFYRDRRFGRVPGIDVPVADLACDGKAGVWAATLGSGLVEVRDGRVTSHAADPGLPENPQALRLFRDSAGRLWVGFRNGGLAVYENGTFRTEAWADARLGEIVRMGEYPAGTLWIGTDRGIFRRRGGSLALMGPEQGLPRERASCFYTDSDGRFWIATGGLYRADDAGAERFSGSRFRESTSAGSSCRTARAATGWGPREPGSSGCGPPRSGSSCRAGSTSGR